MTVHFTIQVPRSPELNEAIDRTAAKLKTLLYVFEPELVQLHGRIVRHTEREGVICKLDLWLPTGKMVAEHTAESAQAALRAGAEELIKQVKKHKQKLRDVHARRRQQVPVEVPAAPPVEAAAMALRQDDLARYFGAHYASVLAFVQRQIQVAERLGELRPGQVDAREVLDEIVVAALSAGPEVRALQRGRGLYLLAAGALQRLRKQSGDRDHGVELQSLDAEVHPDSLDLDGPLEGGSLAPDERDDLRLGDTLTSRQTASPEDVAYTSEVLDDLERALQALPAQQRSDLVLYLLEGFIPEELASLSQRSVEAVRASISQGRESLRKQPGLPPILQQRLQTAPGS